MNFSEDQLPKPLSEMYHYWRSKCQKRTMPSRADIHPSEMKKFLPHTMLIDIVTSPVTGPRLRLRLVGTHIVDNYGQEITGKFSDEIDIGGQCTNLVNACWKSVEDKAPVFLSGIIHLPAKGAKLSFERLGAPLSNDGENVNMLLVAVAMKQLKRD